jgi:hypothetical protein
MLPFWSGVSKPHDFELGMTQFPEWAFHASNDKSGWASASMNASPQRGSISWIQQSPTRALTPELQESSAGREITPQLL